MYNQTFSFHLDKAKLESIGYIGSAASTPTAAKSKQPDPDQKPEQKEKDKAPKCEIYLNFLILEKNKVGADQIMCVKSIDLQTFLERRKDNQKVTEHKGLRKINLLHPKPKASSSGTSGILSDKDKEKENLVMGVLKVEFELGDVHFHTCLQAAKGRQ